MMLMRVSWPASKHARLSGGDRQTRCKRWIKACSGYAVDPLRVAYLRPCARRQAELDLLLAVWSAAFVALTAFMVLMVCAYSVYGGQIVGLQGRYFVYMIPVVLMALPRLRWVGIAYPAPNGEERLLETDFAGRGHMTVGGRGVSPRVQAVLLGLSLAASATIGVAGLIA